MTEPFVKPVFVPYSFIVYKCKISGERVIDIPLPPVLTRSDADRIIAFLKTQVDDDPDPKATP